MEKKEIIIQTADYIKNKLSGESSGHDWWHAYSVWKNANYISQKEGGDLFTIELASLLHDISDWKFNNGNDLIGPKLAKEFLEKLSVEKNTISNVYNIIRDISFKGAKVDSKIKTIEGMIVQDADRLDAIGAIGIARTFAYGGATGREIYNPEIKPQIHETLEQYKNNKSPTINHFYEKLLLLKDLMNTKTAKEIAEQRHEFMLNFLDQFYKESKIK
ncbi:MAG: HD domain-containing protein [Nanoarchaeota archaeon]|nr:HD domain-containing protein [Nanoarchaeota archaeon]